MNELYDKKIIIKDMNGLDKEIMISCLGAKYLPKLFKLAKVLNGSEDETTVFEKLDDNALETMVDLVVVSLVKALPDETVENVEKMVNANFTILIEAVMEVNVPK